MHPTHPPPLAACAVLDVAAPLAVAARADDVPGGGQLPRLAAVQLLQRHPQLVHHRLALNQEIVIVYYLIYCLWTVGMTRYLADLVGLSAPAHAAHAAPEHHVEDVHGRAEAAAAAPAAALLDGLLPTLVIYLPLLSVGQNLVSLQHNTG